MPKLRPYKFEDHKKVRLGIVLLQRARDLFKHVGAKRTADRVRLALSSAKGAERHAATLMFRDTERS
jgi:hypothetical protein